MLTDPVGPIKTIRGVTGATVRAGLHVNSRTNMDLMNHEE